MRGSIDLAGVRQWIDEKPRGPGDTVWRAEHAGREAKVPTPSTSLRAGSHAAKGRRRGGSSYSDEREFVSILTR